MGKIDAEWHRRHVMPSQRSGGGRSGTMSPQLRLP
jgi:hypothetical protein